MKKNITSWGNINNKNIEFLDKVEKGCLTFGNNNSYGDASIPLSNFSLKLDKNIKHKRFSNNFTTIEEYMFSRKKILYGIPGKPNVTLGGAIAADVHGKDCGWAGSFIKNVKTLNIRTAKNENLLCSRNINSEIFYSTIGGYGLTGSIIGVELFDNQEKFTDNFVTEIKNGYGIDNLLNNMTNNRNEYSVAWIDLLDYKNKWILETSKPSSVQKHNNQSENIKNNELNFSFPFIGSNKFKIMNFINNMYYFSKKRNQSIIKNRRDVFYPLGFFSNTKNVSKSRKIIQVQFSLPEKNKKHMDKLLKTLINKQKPILCSLKKLSNNEVDYNFSFIQKGWTVAVDFPYFEFDNISIRKFYKELIDLEGKIYLAKDSTLNEDEFKSMYPNYKNWKKIVLSIDPDNIYQSEMSHRLGIKNW